MNFTDEQLNAIEDVVSNLANDFTFDIYDKDDIGQEIFLISAEILKQYDDSKGELFPFLLGAVKNRLISFRRNNYINHAQSLESVQAKSKMFNTKQIYDTDLAMNDIENHVEFYSDYIDKNIPNNLRADYLRLKEGLSISQSGRSNLVEYISTVSERVKDAG